MASEKRQTPDDQVPITRGVAESTALIFSAMTVTDANDSTPNANLGMSTTLKNMNATPSTSMKQLRSRQPTRSKPLDTRFLSNPHDLQTLRVLRVHNTDPSQALGAAAATPLNREHLRKPRVGSPPRRTSPTASDDVMYF
ncbi:hypothetical protein MRX96_001023 [Rhipicephalus microplus]